MGKYPRRLIESGENSLTLDSPQIQQNRHLRSKVSYDKKLCFICYETKNTDGLPFNGGGLGRFSGGGGNKECYLLEKADPYYQASCRLDAILKVDACDVFSADIYYHKNCYSSYAHPYIVVESKEKDGEKELVIQSFLVDIKRKIIIDKCAFLLHELLNDIMSFSEEVGFEEPVIKDARNLRRRIEKEFKHDISFMAISKYLLVYASSRMWAEG